MAGAPVVAAFIAHAAFWTLLVYGAVTGELGRRGLSVFLGAWLAGRLGLPHVSYEPARAMFPSLVAVLDVAMVLAIFKGDVRL